MSFFSHSSSSNTHKMKKLNKKSTLHSVTSGERAIAIDPEKAHAFGRIQFDETVIVPRSSAATSIFKLQ